MNAGSMREQRVGGEKAIMAAIKQAGRRRGWAKDSEKNGAVGINNGDNMV